jgi:hypothetical protein
LRYGLEIFRRFFDAMVEQCREAGLVWGRELYLDSTQVQANAGRESLTPRFAVEAREALQAHLATLFADTQHHTEDNAEDSQGTGLGSAPRPAAEADSPVSALLEPTPLPVVLTPEQHDALATAHAARHDWLAAAGAQARDVTSRNYQRVADRLVSTTDPDATTIPTKGGLDLGYRTHYVVDGGKARIILTVLVTPSEVMDNQPMLDLLWHTRFHWHLHPRQVTGDRKYGTDESLIAVEAQGIRAYIPSPDMDHRTGCFSGDAFTYDAERDIYVCPAGQDLRYDRSHSTERSRRYRARAKDCNHCPLKAQCTTSHQGRTLCRSVEEACLERVRAYRTTEPYRKALRKRQVWVEPLFAEAKQWHGLRRFRLRRLWRVNSEALLTAAGQNLKRLLQRRGWGRRPLPSGAVLSAQQSTSVYGYFLMMGFIAPPRRWPCPLSPLTALLPTAAWR